MLTESDRDIIARARELAGGPVTAADPGTDPAWVLADALGRAQYLLAELADRLERLGA